MSVELMTESRPKASNATVKLWLTRTRELVALAYEQPMPPYTQMVEWIEAYNGVPVTTPQWLVKRCYAYRGQERAVSFWCEAEQTEAGRDEVFRLIESEDYQKAFQHAVRGWMARVDNPELFESL